MRLDLGNSLDLDLDLYDPKLYYSTQKMRLDLGNRLNLDLVLNDANFMNYALHKLYELVEGITREVNLEEFTQSIQKMRLDNANTVARGINR